MGSGLWYDAGELATKYGAGRGRLAKMGGLDSMGLMDGGRGPEIAWFGIWGNAWDAWDTNISSERSESGIIIVLLHRSACVLEL